MSSTGTASSSSRRGPETVATVSGHRFDIEASGIGQRSAVLRELAIRLDVYGDAPLDAARHVEADWPDMVTIRYADPVCEGAEDEHGNPICPGVPVREFRAVHRPGPPRSLRDRG